MKYLFEITFLILNAICVLMLRSPTIIVLNLFSAIGMAYLIGVGIGIDRYKKALRDLKKDPKG